jgi:hypothetical protein
LGGAKGAYAEITSEHMIRSTFRNLAIQVDGKLSLLIEVKAVGLDLKHNHIKQAIDYAANQGCDSFIPRPQFAIWSADGFASVSNV